MEAQEERLSREDQQMKNFKLVDRFGNTVSCIAFGRHAGHPGLVDGTEVIVYFAIAQSGKRNEDGNLWIYDSSHVFVLGSSRPVPRVHKHMNLRQQRE